MPCERSEQNTSTNQRSQKHANCRGEITPTAVVYIVHTLYIHVWILPLSAKLVHIELLLTHKLATVNLWLLIAAYEQSLICYRTRCKHSYIPGAYCRKHLLIPCPTSTIVGHILAIVSNKHMRAVWAKRTEYSIEQIRQSLQRLKIAKIVRVQNLHNFQTIDSVFFFSTHVCDTSCQSLTHAYRKHIKVGHSSRCALTRSRSSKPPSQSRRP